MYIVLNFDLFFLNLLTWMDVTDEIYYKASSSGTIKCRDGSLKFTKSQLNDDFCDCPDGTDEPGLLFLLPTPFIPCVWSKDSWRENT